MFRDGTDRRTHGHGDSMTNSALWGRVGEKKIEFYDIFKIHVVKILAFSCFSFFGSKL